MPTDYLKLFIPKLLSAIEERIMAKSQNLNTLNSLKDQLVFTDSEQHWAHKILFEQLTPDDLTEIEELGARVYENGSSSLSDLLELMESTHTFCKQNFPNFEQSIDIKELNANVNQIKQAIAKGYFLATVLSFKKHIMRSSTKSYVHCTQTTRLHKEWFIKLCDFFLDPEPNPPPALDEHSCHFSQWIDSLQAQLILHSKENAQNDIKNAMMHTHHKMHTEAQISHIHFQQSAWIKAVSHFEQLSNAFLLLDKYINEAYFNYYSNAYHYFLEFALEIREKMPELKYFLVWNKSLENHPELFFQQKRENLHIFAKDLINQLQADEFDFISIEQDEKLHIIFAPKTSENASELDDEQIINRGFLAYQRHSLGKSTGELCVNIFCLADIELTTPETFKPFINKTVRTEDLLLITHFNQQTVQQYCQEIMADKDFVHQVIELINQQKLLLFYQPIVDHTGHFMSVESLARLPFEGKHIDAERFIHLIEDYGLATELDSTVLSLLQKDIAALKTITKNVNVNLFPNSLKQTQIIDSLIALNHVCEKNGLQLIVEITEYQVVQHKATIQQLHRQYQMQFAVDDFGTGYSNLASLIDLAVDQTVQMVKIDGVMIQKIDTQLQQRNMVEFIAKMALQLGISNIVVEFVDSKKKLDILQGIPAELLYQGYYFGKAMPIQQLQNHYLANAECAPSQEQ